MTGAFRIESRLFRIVDKAVSLIKLNILWILFSIPLFTGGAALCALHIPAVRIMKNEEGYIFRDFWNVFRDKLALSLKLWTPLMTAAALFLDCMFWRNVEGNFAAGMSGGVAYVLDVDSDLYRNVNKQMVNIERISSKYDVNELKGMIEEHVACTNSEIGKEILERFKEYLPKFKKIIPVDYERMLTTILQLEEQGMSSEQAKTEAFYAMKGER